MQKEEALDIIEENEELKFFSNPNKNHIVLDVDEILVDIAPKWVSKIYDHRDYFKSHLKLWDNFDINDKSHLMKVEMRRNFRINEWLSNGKEQDEGFLKDLIDLYNVSNFYDDLEPTKIGKAMSMAATTNMVSKISIISRTMDGNKDSKVKFINKLFESSLQKLDIYLVESGEKKSSVFSILGDDIACYFDDEINNQVDVLLNSNNCKDLLIYSPQFGYNNPSSKLLKLANDKGCQLIRYNTFE